MALWDALDPAEERQVREPVSRPAVDRPAAPKAGVSHVRVDLASVVHRDPAREREADDAAASALRDRQTGPPVGRAAEGRLDRSAQEFFATRFGHDLSHVRVHTDERAAGVARMLGASALTVGRDIYFGRGAYEPHSPEGSRLLAHELAHVVQQDHLARPQIQGKLVATGDAAGFAAAANSVIAVQYEVVVGKTGEVSIRSTDVQGPPTPEAQELVRVIRLVIADAKTTTVEFIHGQTSTRASDAMVLGGNYQLSRVDLDDVAALGSQESIGVGMGRTGGSLLAHELLEQHRKQVHGEGFAVAHAAATAAEEVAVGATRGAERFSNATDANNFTVTIPYTYPDGRVVEVTWDVVDGNYENVRRRVVPPAKKP